MKNYFHKLGLWVLASVLLLIIGVFLTCIWVFILIFIPFAAIKGKAEGFVIYYEDNKTFSIFSKLNKEQRNDYQK